MPRGNMAFTGIPTFGRAPVVKPGDPWEADVAILGVPFDEGTGFRPGTRFGPRSIREMSMRFAFFDPESGNQGYYDPDLNRRLLHGVTAVDCGDVDIIYLNVARDHALMEQGVRDIRSHGAFPLILGGDHSITYPVLRAFDDEEAITLAHFDAHLDYRDSFLGVTLAHGSPIRRCSELPFVKDIISVGLRGLRTVESDLIDALSFKSTVITYRQYRSRGKRALEEAISGKARRAYVTVDIDSVNPAACPGTGTPEADGFALGELVDLLRIVAGRLDVIGFDLVEVNPALDYSGITSLAAAQIAMEFLGEVFSREVRPR